MSGTEQIIGDIVVPLATFALGLVAQPFVGRVTDRFKRKDDKLEEARAVVGEVGRLLAAASIFDISPEVTKPSKTLWGEVGPRLENLYQFPPSPDLQQPFETLWKLLVHLLVAMDTLSGMSVGDPEWEKIEQVRKRDFETAMKELDVTRKRLGGTALSAGLKLSNIT
jgi:hypothetical protein